MLNHVESEPPKKCFFLLSCWICWICWINLDTTGQNLPCSARKHSTYSTYSTWQLKEAHFLRPWFNMIQHIQHDSWKKHIFWKMCPVQLSCWILCFFCRHYSARKHSTYSTYSTWQLKEAHFLRPWFNMIQHIQHDSWKKHIFWKMCPVWLSCWILGFLYNDLSHWCPKIQFRVPV